MNPSELFIIISKRHDEINALAQQNKTDISLLIKDFRDYFYFNVLEDHSQPGQEGLSFIFRMPNFDDYRNKTINIHIRADNSEDEASFQLSDVFIENEVHPNEEVALMMYGDQFQKENSIIKELGFLTPEAFKNYLLNKRLITSANVFETNLVDFMEKTIVDVAFPYLKDLKAINNHGRLIKTQKIQEQLLKTINFVISNITNKKI